MLIEFEVKIELPIGLNIILPLDGLKQVLYTVRGECRFAKYAHNLEHWSPDFEVVLNDGNETVRDDGDVYLNSHSVLRLSPKPLDLKMLLDPFEEELHLPSIFIEKGDFLRFEVEVVRIVDKAAVKLRNIVDNASDDTRILLPVRLLSEADALVFEHIICSIKDAISINNLIVRLSFFPNNEESSKHMDAIEPRKVKVSSVKDIAGQRLVCKPVHRVDIMYVGVGNPVEHGNLRNNVNLRVNLDARLRAPELCPPKYRHAEVDGRGVDGVESAVQFKFLCNPSLLCKGYHMEGKLLKATVVSELVGLRKHLPVDRLSAKAEKHRLPSMGNSKVCKFPQTAAAHELTEHQNQHVIPMRHRPTLGSVVVLGDYAPELPLREELDYLCKNELSNMHTYSELKSDAKVSISKPGQGVVELKRYA